jgi:uncharacterized membrane protein YeiH
MKKEQYSNVAGRQTCDQLLWETPVYWIWRPIISVIAVAALIVLYIPGLFS